MTTIDQKVLLRERWKLVEKTKVPVIQVDEVYRDLNRGIQKIELSVNDIK